MPRDFVGSGITNRPSSLTPGVIYLFSDAAQIIWTKGGTSGDSVLDLDASAGFTSEKGMRLRPRTTSAGQGDTVNATLEMSHGLGNFLQFRFRYSFGQGDSFTFWQVRMKIWNAVKSFEFGMQVDPVNNYVKYLNSAGNYVATAINNASGSAGRWGNVVLSCDGGSGKYGQLIIDGRDQGITGELGEEGIASELRFVRVNFDIEAEDDGVPVLFLDDMILVDQLNI